MVESFDFKIDVLFEMDIERNANKLANDFPLVEFIAVWILNKYCGNVDGCWVLLLVFVNDHWWELLLVVAAFFQIDLPVCFL